MDLSTCTSYFQSLGLSVQSRLVYGIKSGYPLFFQLNGNGQNVASVVLRVQLQNQLSKPQRKEIKALFKKRCIVGFIGHTLQLTITINSKNGDLSICNAIMQDTLQFLQNNMVSPAETCPFCKQDNCDSAVFYQGAYQKAHANCVGSAMGKITENVKKNEDSGSYILGIIGALLGGIVGILPSILSIWFVERIYALLYALIPICIYWGYRLLKGKMTKGVIGITIILSIFFLFFMEFVLLNMAVYQEYGLLLIRECFDLFMDPEVFTELLGDMATSFLFLVFGIIYSWRMITVTNSGMGTNAEFTMSTVLPLNPETYSAPINTDSYEDSANM